MFTLFLRVVLLLKYDETKYSKILLDLKKKRVFHQGIKAQATKKIIAKIQNYKTLPETKSQNC